MATASASWASLLIEPCDIAPVQNRLTISLAGSTSSSGTGSPAGLNSNRPRSVQSLRLWSLTAAAYSSYALRVVVGRTACWRREIVCGVPQVVLAVAAVVVLAAELQLQAHPLLAVRGEAPPRCRASASRAITSSPTPSIREAVPVKYLSTTSLVEPDRLEQLGARGSCAASRCPSWTSS